MKAHQNNPQQGEDQVSDQVKFNIFQSIMDSLFVSFSNSVSMSSFQELSACVFSWIEEHCKPQVRNAFDWLCTTNYGSLCWDNYSPCVPSVLFSFLRLCESLWLECSDSWTGSFIDWGKHLQWISRNRLLTCLSAWSKREASGLATVFTLASAPQWHPGCNWITSSHFLDSIKRFRIE